MGEAAEVTAVTGATPPARVTAAVLAGLSALHSSFHFQCYTKLFWWKMLNYFKIVIFETSSHADSVVSALGAGKREDWPGRARTGGAVTAGPVGSA